jgi:hypothetical protein
MDYLKVQKKAMTDLYKSMNGKKADRWFYEKIDVHFYLSNGSFAVRIPETLFLLNKDYELLGKSTSVIGSILDMRDSEDYKEVFFHYTKTVTVYGKKMNIACLSNSVSESERFTININSKLIDFFGKSWELTFYAKDSVNPVFIRDTYDNLLGLIMPMRVNE